MNANTVARVKTEFRLLAQDLGVATHPERRLAMGLLSVDGLEYIGVQVKDLPVPYAKFGVQRLKMLVLVPQDYPRIPPLGVYLDRPYDAESRHFTRAGYHGAPTLTSRGWYWFCTAFGDFDAPGVAWRATPEPEDGHNLATVITGARVSLGI